MGLLEIILTGIGLSMDALAVSVCKGLSMKRLKVGNAFIIALFFGAFQALMPLAGWLLGINFQMYIETFDHWIAFVLLLFIGGKMLIDSLKDDGEINNSDKSGDKLDIKELGALAVATSIDALAVGIAMACLDGGIGIVPAVHVIGAITFVICLAGVFIGHKFGNKFEKNAGFAGGIILVLIGVKILLEHVGILDAIFEKLPRIF